MLKLKTLRVEINGILCVLYKLWNLGLCTNSRRIITGLPIHAGIGIPVSNNTKPDYNNGIRPDQSKVLFFFSLMPKFVHLNHSVFICVRK